MQIESPKEKSFEKCMPASTGPFIIYCFKLFYPGLSTKI